MPSKKKTTQTPSRRLFGGKKSIGIAIMSLVFVVASGLVLYNNLGQTNALYISEGGCYSTATLRYGSRGNCVKVVQNRLNNQHRKCRGLSLLAVDGIFGSGTRSAVIAYQRTAGLTQDGVVGPNTWNSLLSGRINCGK